MLGNFSYKNATKLYFGDRIFELDISRCICNNLINEANKHSSRKL